MARSCGRTPWSPCVAVSLLVEEERWRLNELEENKKFEQLLHGFFRWSLDSDRSVLLDDVIPLIFMSTKS